MTQMLGPEVDTISVDYALVRDIVDKVNDLIDQDAKQRGRRLGRADERQLAMARTMDVIVREGAARARQGLDMWSEVQENAIRDAVMDSMFGLGRIQKWLLNPDIEDLYIAGTRPAHARLSDGSIVECGVVADTDEELIEQLRIIATHGSSTERQMVSCPADHRHAVAGRSAGRRHVGGGARTAPDDPLPPLRRHHPGEADRHGHGVPVDGELPVRGGAWPAVHPGDRCPGRRKNHPSPRARAVR